MRGKAGEIFKESGVEDSAGLNILGDRLGVLGPAEAAGLHALIACSKKLPLTGHQTTEAVESGTVAGTLLTEDSLFGVTPLPHGHGMATLSCDDTSDPLRRKWGDLPS
ncbi:hypothetical protein JIN84_08860 [Luteolibacter yonseiensis]|uniref:Uncharacterized protein n=1 Tax=Luteolibacter yonseiensis TaxID=1144680 RepID=A0A934R5Q2_9BACT|nr:hypothetical protein [Luteolibacter yonseiensis]MBK1815725.1 hypothetical protein [Luteolibacter yonseiensis]